MLAPDQYQLLDFGDGRKLERFGRYVLDRPSPAAEGTPRRFPPLWDTADAHFERGEHRTGEWSGASEIAPWQARVGPLVLELKLTEFGHLGLFPEQADNWRWIDQQVRAAGRVKLLNLFGYTGASTLVAAAAGAEVVHLDAAANVVAWARRNAEASGLAAAPIRWIVDDALKFVRRELKRGNHYDAVLMDPPAYGHGPRGQTWKLDEHLEELLSACCTLCRDRARFMLLTCHSGTLATADGLQDFVRRQSMAADTALCVAYCDMQLATSSGARLSSGAAVQWSRGADLGLSDEQ